MDFHDSFLTLQFSPELNKMLLDVREFVCLSACVSVYVCLCVCVGLCVCVSVCGGNFGCEYASVGHSRHFPMMAACVFAPPPCVCVTVVS